MGIDTRKALEENASWTRNNHFNHEPVNRMIIFNDQEANKTKICMLRSRRIGLGNSVVPQFTEHVFLRLTCKLQEKLTDPPTVHSVRSNGSKANMFQRNMNGFIFCDDSDI
eukprot:57299-Pelagomonas_calceolata.AAC.1